MRQKQREPADEEILVDKRRAARKLSICSKTLETLTKDGVVPSVRLGRRVLYRVSTLKRVAEQLEK
jgi:hypothetical protein